VSASCTVGLLTRAMDGHIMRCGATGSMPISCHFLDCKALLVASLTHVGGALTSVQTFTFRGLPLVRIDLLELFALTGPVTLTTRPVHCHKGSSPHFIVVTGCSAHALSLTARPLGVSAVCLLVRKQTECARPCFPWLSVYHPRRRRHA